MRALITGWPSFVHGEATAGDVLSMRRVADELHDAGWMCDLAFSPNFDPEAPHLDGVCAERYQLLVFACGPCHGWQVEWLHERFARCVRVAVGVSVIDLASPAVTGFHRVFARDGLGAPSRDLSASARTRALRLVGVTLAPGQQEYGERRMHDEVHEALSSWLTTLPCARLELDTRLDTSDWRGRHTADEFTSILGRLDALVTTRLHGLVLALRAGIPVLAVDPVDGGGKVGAQAGVWRWPGVLSARDALRPGALDELWQWCVSEEGRAEAARRSA